MIELRTEEIGNFKKIVDLEKQIAELKDPKQFKLSDGFYVCYRETTLNSDSGYRLFRVLCYSHLLMFRFDGTVIIDKKLGSGSSVYEYLTLNGYSQIAKLIEGPI